MKALTSHCRCYLPANKTSVKWRHNRASGVMRKETQDSDWQFFLRSRHINNTCYKVALPQKTWWIDGKSSESDCRFSSLVQTMHPWPIPTSHGRFIIVFSSTHRGKTPSMLEQLPLSATTELFFDFYWLPHTWPRSLWGRCFPSCYGNQKANTRHQDYPCQLVRANLL
jgi:hypothetical protein